MNYKLVTCAESKPKSLINLFSFKIYPWLYSSTFSWVRFVQKTEQHPKDKFWNSNGFYF